MESGEAVKISGLPVALFSLYPPIFFSSPFIFLYFLKFALYALYFRTFDQISMKKINETDKSHFQPRPSMGSCRGVYAQCKGVG